ncbi:MAG: NYN domain-containing protein [Candidatus Omnitrophota bacterium]
MALHFIVDGYNVINKVPFLNRKKLRDARDALLSFIYINRPHGSINNKITVVFDGKEDVLNFKSNYDFPVVFAKKESADDHIKQIVENAPNPKTIIIVSDDKDIMLFCRSQGARILSVNDFIKKPNKKTKTTKDLDKDFFELSYLERKKINEELSKIWLK